MLYLLGVVRLSTCNANGKIEGGICRYWVFYVFCLALKQDETVQQQRNKEKS